MSSSSDERCKAVTEDGERCARPAQENGFCHQHDESDAEAEADGGEQRAQERPDDDIVEIRDTVKSIGRDLIGNQIDGIIGVSPSEDGWQVTVEVVERKSVPDTQDIIGRYELDLNSDRSVSGYRRLDRYRRADTDKGEFRE